MKYNLLPLFINMEILWGRELWEMGGFKVVG
jgi:hypothetical protein